jgi:hypothetical protein
MPFMPARPVLSSVTVTPDLLHRLIERLEIKADGSERVFYRFSLPSAIILHNFSNHSAPHAS